MRCRGLAVLALSGLLLVGPACAKEHFKLVKLKVGPFPIEANRDREICQAIRLQGVAGMEVAVSEARSRRYRKGQVSSHHLVVYGYNGADAAAFPSGLVDDPGCGDFGPTDFFTRRSFLSGSGGEATEGNWTVTRVSMPGDLAQVVPTNPANPGESVLVVNSHYFNVSSKRAHGYIKVALKLRPLDPRKRVVRQVIHSGASDDIFVPPGSTQTVTSAWRADGQPNLATEGGVNPSVDTCVFTVASHMHKRGMEYTADYRSHGTTVALAKPWHDYIHPLILLRPVLDGVTGLLRAYTAENGFPEVAYACRYANGVEGVEPKLGCEETPGVAPGIRLADAAAHGRSPLDSHAQPCGQDGVNCDGKPCVPANLVFGPLSDDDMCILTASIYDPLPGVAPEHACDLVFDY